MKKKIVGIFVMGLLIGTMLSVVNSVSACTGFTAYDGEKVLVGANMDWSQNFNMYMHFFPAEEGKFGRVIIDLKFALIDWEPYPDDPDWISPKEGMNDQGLFYSIFVHPYLLPEKSNDKPIFYSDDPDYYTHALHAYCLAKCKTVSEVLDVFDDYNLVGMHQYQVFFADRNGDSLIIEGDDIIYKEGDFQVITNFLHSHPELGFYPCWRYETAVSMLENMNELSCEYFRSICNATHQKTTVHSDVYDLREGIFYVNFNNNFENPLEFDLNEELAKGKRRIHIGSLFEPEDNHPPDKPDAPIGDETGIPGTDYRYSCKKTSDPDGDRIMYLFDWGDGTDSGWIVPQYGTIRAYHNWTERGNFEVRVKAMDVYGRESEWSDPLSVTMPKNKLYINSLIQNFLENHPIIYQLIQRFLKL
ncbi:MAG: hypothetical protein JSV67_02530 [Thermoplasmatales archaeon]|nr:MAG: hypothetical protein JSV67_02530 [Thermoplasmatales archaeon]